MNHLQLQKLLWKSVVQKGDTVIDATCGNGHDTHYLQTLSPGRLIAIDKQLEAINNSKSRVVGVEWYHQCHSTFPESVQKSSVSLIVYNLGYLPGGDKQLITKTDTTLKSIKNGLELLKPGGMISLTIYTGHPGGQEEEEAIITFANTLPSNQYRVQNTKWLNYHNHPSLLTITT